MAANASADLLTRCLLQTIERELTKDEKLAEEELREAERYLEGIEKQYEPSLLQGPFKIFQNFKLPFFTGKIQ